MKRNNKVFSLIVFLGLCFSLSHIMAAENNYSQVRGTVATVSKYGNLEMDMERSTR